MFRKKFIRVWAGPLPVWIDDWRRNTAALKPYGFEFHLETNLAKVAARAWKRLGVRLDVPPGTRKAGDLDPVLGVLFEEELRGFDFWGHCGLDVVFGRLDRFVSDTFLTDCDVFGNDPNAICGPFSLYRNVPKVNQLFLDVGRDGPVGDAFGRTFDSWVDLLTEPTITGWDEGAFSRAVVAAAATDDIRFKSAFWQSHDKQPGHLPRPRLSIRDDGTLYDEALGREIMMFHFNRKDIERVWPVF